MEVISTMQSDLMPDILNIGCGSDIMNGAVNVDSSIPDILKLAGNCITGNDTILIETDITGANDLPKNYFKRIHATMVLEHVHPDLIPNLLYCLSNFLQPNGALIATVPNFRHLAELILITAEKKLICNVDTLGKFRETTNEFMCPTMCSMGGHQSIWIEPVANIWLSAEGLKLVSWVESVNKMHVTFKAIKVGGDHVSPAI